ncbi:MAG: hypothetical protein JRJ01_04490 [Deltaproteobacteria bacterium]|nr:hypothetical protein [Deltaproteobacteria bacterium]
MIRTLVSLNADLASSIALRYVCQFADKTSMDIKTIHVEEPESDGNPPGTGWVRRTWEKGLLGSAETEIAQLINAERTLYPSLCMPKLLVGDRDDEILRELHYETYDLFAEGLLYSFRGINFDAKIHSKLYRKMPCPVLLVKNLVSVDKIALLMDRSSRLNSLLFDVSKILGGTGIQMDLFEIRVEKSSIKTPGEKRGPTFSPGDDKNQGRIPSSVDKFRDAGLELAATGTISGDIEAISTSLEDYGMVVACLPRHGYRKSKMADILGRIPTAVLICWQ